MSGRPTSPDEPTHDGQAPVETDLALYALGALDDHELRAIETLLATDAQAAALEGRLRWTAGALGAAASGIDTAPPLDLRDRVLAAARAERPPVAVETVAASPVALHRVLGERLVELVSSLGAAEWDAPVDPPEFAGWTVRDLVAHLAAVEAYLAARLGITDPTAPETATSNEARTEQAITRHRTLPAAHSIAELTTFLGAVDHEIDRLGPSIDQPIDWWGLEHPIAQVLVIRSFELWIHAADIARAIGRPEPVPAPGELRTMSNLAAALTPMMCAVSGALAPPTAPASGVSSPGDIDLRWVRIALTGPGGGTHDVNLDPHATGLVGSSPTATIHLDVVEYCRAVANRVDSGGTHYEHTGAPAVAAAVVASLPALATL